MLDCHAPVAHSRLQQVAQVLEGRRQGPALQRRRLVQRARLGLKQGQVVQRVVDELAMAIGREAVFGTLSNASALTWPSQTPRMRAWSATITERL